YFVWGTDTIATERSTRTTMPFFLRYRRQLQLALSLFALLLAVPVASGAARSHFFPARTASSSQSPAIATLAPASTDTSTIALVGNLPGSATHVQVAGNRAYVGSDAGLRIVDISNPASPTLLGTYAGPVADVQVAGSLAYIASDASLKIVDVGSPARPVL